MKGPSLHIQDRPCFEHFRQDFSNCPWRDASRHGRVRHDPFRRCQFGKMLVDVSIVILIHCQ